MSTLMDFSPEQKEEVTNWLKENCEELLAFAQVQVELRDKPESNRYFLIDWLCDMYFRLKMISIELRPNQFVIGVDYKGSGDKKKDYEDAKAGKIPFNLSFWNPHPLGVTNELARDFLIAQLSKL